MIPAEYVLARSVLLDALDALGAHHDAIVLVGAQAIYLHCGDAEFATAPMTTDADLALAPERLADEPKIAAAMAAGGFVVGDQPGTWLGRGGVAVDLMVAEALSGPAGRRGARLGRHGDRTARRTVGLEAAMVDNDVHQIGPLDVSDPRSFELKVAGPAALLVAKMIKIAERCHQPRRLKPKDGLDVLRLLRAVEPAELANRLNELASHELTAAVVHSAVQAFRDHGRDPDQLLPSLAATAEQGYQDLDVIRMSTAALVDELLDGVAV